MQDRMTPAGWHMSEHARKTLAMPSSFRNRRTPVNRNDEIVHKGTERNIRYVSSVRLHWNGSAPAHPKVTFLQAQPSHYVQIY
jgi:hypothetical protein